jgi:conjugal transfer/entry exclusion protein
MSDISLEYKFNLKNKYLNKIIKNIDEVNNYLKLLNKFNHKMIRQYGGTQQEFDEIHASITTESDKISGLNIFAQNQIKELHGEQEKLLKNIDDIQKIIEKLPAKTNSVLNTENTKQALNQMEQAIIGPK